jgi:hypothetical protein
MKKISYLLIGIFILSSCSQDVTDIHKYPTPGKYAESFHLLGTSPEIDGIKKILSSQSPNIAMVELLMKTVPNERKNEVKKIMTSLPLREVEKIMRQVKSQNENVRRDALYHGQLYEEMSFIKDALHNEVFLNSSSMEKQLTVSVFTYIKNKALQDIVSAYDRKARQIINELIDDFSFDISRNKFLLEKISKEMNHASKDKVIEIIKSSDEFKNKKRTYFTASDLVQMDQYSSFIVGHIAEGIYLKVKNDNGLKKILQQRKGGIRDENVFKKKAQAAVLLVKTIGNHIDSTTLNVREFSQGLTDSAKHMSLMIKNSNVKDPKFSDQETKGVVNFLYQRIFLEQKVLVSGNHSSHISHIKNIHESIQRSHEAADRMEHHLDNILLSSEDILTLLKVEPNNDLHKVISSATEVAQSLSKVTQHPFSTAISLSSAPMLAGWMGGGGIKDSDMLEEIKCKLDILIENQIEMIKRQKETLELIKNIALMVDQYHQNQMVSSSELRDFSVVSSEREELQSNMGIASCEQLVGNQLNSKLSDDVTNLKHDFNINNVKLLTIQFNSSMRDLSSIQSITKSVKKNDFENCLESISSAFGDEYLKDNPLQTMYLSDKKKHLFNFERDKFQPVLATLAQFYPNTNLDILPFHFPSRDLKMLKEKTKFMLGQINSGNSGHEIYDVEHLISVHALERNLTSLFILYPLLELDKADWAGDYEEIVNTYILRGQKRTRSATFLRNALKITQSAIAQESLLAGEPILQGLLFYKKNILSNQKCDVEFLCGLKNNTLLMKNFVLYSLNHQNTLIPDFFIKYEKAYLTADLASLARFLSPSLNDKNLKVLKNNDGSEIMIEIKSNNRTIIGKETIILVQLPSPKTLREGKILYSENMERLLLMQDLIIENLEKVTPIDRMNDQENLVHLLMAAN